MKKRFNTTGICRAELHYMMDTSQKLKEVMELVEFGAYFTINRPRQYGKTTMLQSLFYTFQKEENYIAIEMSFQGIDGKWHESDNAFAMMFIQLLTELMSYELPDLTDFLTDLKGTVSDMNTLSSAITKIIHKTNKKVILLIDEVDASSNYLPFLSFLAMLRTKYLSRFKTYHATFHSIVLAGVHDIKSLKYKKEHAESASFNSPWNIAVDFKVRMSFIPVEIEPMLVDYCQLEKVTMDIRAIAERLYYHTSGYPFLVSKICKTIAEDILPKKTEKTWTLTDVEAAIQQLLKENNTNFDSLIKNLENNEGLYDLAYEVIVNGATIPFNPDEPMIALGRLYGIFKANGLLKIHNRLYEQRLYNYMTAKTFQKLLRQRKHNFGTVAFINDDNTLNLEAVLLKFQQFMKEQYSNKVIDYLEKEWRILFLAFLKPILNGKGYDFKEVEVSEEKRLDVVVTFLQHRYIIELKQWYGPKAHQKGIKQLGDYLDIHNVAAGFLLIFDGRKKKKWTQETIKYDGKSIFAVWV